MNRNFKEHFRIAAALSLIPFYFDSPRGGAFFLLFPAAFAVLTSFSRLRLSAPALFEAFWIAAIGTAAQLAHDFLTLPPYWAVSAYLLIRGNKEESGGAVKSRILWFLIFGSAILAAHEKIVRPHPYGSVWIYWILALAILIPKQLPEEAAE